MERKYTPHELWDIYMRGKEKREENEQDEDIGRNGVQENFRKRRTD